MAADSSPDALPSHHGRPIPAADDPTRRARPREALIVEALVEILRMLDARGETPHGRELRARARSYELALRQWSTFPPSEAQLEAMFDLVSELHGKAVDLGRARP